MPPLNVDTEFEPETGRWIAEVVDVGALVYGDTEADAVRAAVELAHMIAADEAATPPK